MSSLPQECNNTTAGHSCRPIGSQLFIASRHAPQRKNHGFGQSSPDPFPSSRVGSGDETKLIGTVQLLERGERWGSKSGNEPHSYSPTEETYPHSPNPNPNPYLLSTNQHYFCHQKSWYLNTLCSTSKITHLCFPRFATCILKYIEPHLNRQGLIEEFFVEFFLWALTE